MRLGGQLLTLPCAAQRRVAPKGVRAAFRARSHLSKRQKPSENLPVVNEPFVADALVLEGRGKEFA